MALIDEFQDTDPIQWRILSRAFQPERHRLVMVGDPKQAIYRFRGGELATYQRARAVAASGGGISSLTDNYRASEALVGGLNGLMEPGLRRSGLAVPEVRAQRHETHLTLPGGQHPLQLLWLGGERLAGQKPPSRSALERQLGGQIASFTAALLNRGLVQERPGQRRPLGPNDICLLVSTHRQAEVLRGELEACGIASRLVSQGDVLDSEGATALQRLLDALAEPGRANRLRLLAASPSWAGVPPGSLAPAGRSGAAWRRAWPSWPSSCRAADCSGCWPACWSSAAWPGSPWEVGCWPICSSAPRWWRNASTPTSWGPRRRPTGCGAGGSNPTGTCPKPTSPTATWWTRPCRW